MEYYSEINRNNLSSHKRHGWILKCIVLKKRKRRRSQSKKAIYSLVPITWHFGKWQNYRGSEKIINLQGSRERGRRVKWLNTVSFLGWWNYSVWYCNYGYVTPCMCQNPQKFTAQRVSLNVCKLKMQGSQDRMQEVTDTI